MIYTLTLNPSLDYNISMKEFIRGKTNKVDESNKHPGGKGINVSQVLRNFGIKSIALGFLGGLIGEYIENKLKEKGILCNFVHIKDETRINIKMKCGKEESEINGNPPNITIRDLELLIRILSNLSEEDVLVLSGSIPDSLPITIYRDIMRLVDKGVKVIVDTRGDGLLATLVENPYLIKPNHHELEELAGKKLATVSECIVAAKHLYHMGASNVVVSLGKHGALLVNDKVYYGRAPVGELKNSVGAGDSLVAGIVVGLHHESDIIESFKLGLACGSATAFSEGLCSEEESLKLFENIKIEVLE